MDLFDFPTDDQSNLNGRPLADRMRPQTLDEFVGQEQIVGQGRLLRRAIQADKLTPMIFFGPPGTGKTTLAHIIAQTTSAYYEQLNAVTSGVGDIRKIIAAAEERLKFDQQKTILFIDEIHRFNKGQQDALLPSVEKGTIILIGATTESPMFEINAALLSRSRLFRFEPLTDKAIRTILSHALTDKKRGYGESAIEVDEDALDHLVRVANGDSRTALHALELAVLTTDPNADGVIHIDRSVAEESIQEKVLQYDKNGDNHYDTVSAFIKSMRGSDPNATLYWLAKMIAAGEDPKFIARRIFIHAAEDVGLADPNAILIANTAVTAVTFIGMPEARIPLAEAALYVATAPKSNAVISGIDEALAAVKDEKTGDVPIHLRDAHYKGAAKLGHGKGYLYPHDFEDGYVPQDYLPDKLRSKHFYHPSPRGYERTVQKRLDYFVERDKKKR
ncbi:AAA family ATPase [Sporolactobacillus terrae]|uniref:Replication-associated recombination protein A n=1 Tax=Sporolactobacillus terrae TaxID=269673 RepID=A0A410DDE3_9BACL|nr:AAA family ATPase [Sporolactobacillus terrae]QAA22884.1 replication-associated recombination protein RarA [Sporolactobacillus terrae]QAA27022.1 replication-associated recombination protein RarA [Sporolactobacillus terrae]UAK17731.1 AAA family ATPase [Sporolactobacillus terrae]BBN99283.1 ATPase AAA [Sporolactobacillus terrae]